MSAAAIEAAAKAWFDRGQAARRDDGRKAPDGGPWTWEHLSEDGKHALRAVVAPIVSAALAAATQAPESGVGEAPSLSG